MSLCKTTVGREISRLIIREFKSEINCDITVQTIARGEYLIIKALSNDFVRD